MLTNRGHRFEQEVPSDRPQSWRHSIRLHRATPGLLLLLALDVVIGLFSYRLSYVLRSLSTFGFFEAMPPTAFGTAPHAFLLIVALQVVTVWLAGGYGPGYRTVSRGFIARLVVACFGQSILLALVYPSLLGSSVYRSVFSVYGLLDAAFVLVGRLLSIELVLLQREGLASLRRLPQAWSRTTQAEAIPEAPPTHPAESYVTQATELLDELEVIRRSRAGLDARMADVPADLAARMVAGYDRRRAELYSQVGPTFRVLLVEGARARRSAAETAKELAQLEVQAAEIRLRRDVGELDGEAFEKREAARLDSVTACQRAARDQTEAVGTLEILLRRLSDALPDTGFPPSHPSHLPRIDGSAVSALHELTDLEAGFGATAAGPLLQRAHRYVRVNPSRAFMIGVQALLAVCVLLLIMKANALAEGVGNIAYLLLAVAVGINVAEIVREGSIPTANDGAGACFGVGAGSFHCGHASTEEPRLSSGLHRRASSLTSLLRLFGAIGAGPRRSRYLIILPALGVALVALIGVLGRGGSGTMIGNHASGPKLAVPSAPAPVVNVVRPVSPSPRASLSQLGQLGSASPTAPALTHASTPATTPRPGPIGALYGSWPSSTPAASAAELPEGARTPTAAAGTGPIPRPAPSLLSPDPGAVLTGPVTLSWFLPLAARVDEVFEIRAWAGAAVPTVVSRTREIYFVWQPPAPGTYNWQVAIIRSGNGAVSEPEIQSPVRQFVWAGR